MAEERIDYGAAGGDTGAEPLTTRKVYLRQEGIVVRHWAEEGVVYTFVPTEDLDDPGIRHALNITDEEIARLGAEA